MKRLFVLLSLLLITVVASAQQIPINDDSWVLVFEDNFDGNVIDTTKWRFHQPWGTCDYNAKLTDPYEGGRNHILNNGILSLTINRETDSVVCWECCDNPPNGICTRKKGYTSGALLSKQGIDFKYGYFEMRCKLPQYNNPKKTKGFGASFWLWPLDGMPNNIKWSEIDIFETFYDEELGIDNKYTFNAHYEDTMYFDNDEKHAFYQLREYLIERDYYKHFEFDDFHKFACSWSPEYLDYYVDDSLVYRTTLPYYDSSRNVTQHFVDDLIPMNIWIGPSVGFYSEVSEESVFPYKFDIDYVRVYQLIPDCERDYTSGIRINTTFGRDSLDISPVNFYSSFDHKVKRNITLKHKVPKNSNYYFRAVESINLNNGFEVPIGSSVYMNIEICPE